MIVPPPGAIRESSRTLHSKVWDMGGDKFFLGQSLGGAIHYINTQGALVGRSPAWVEIAPNIFEIEETALKVRFFAAQGEIRFTPQGAGAHATTYSIASIGGVKWNQLSKNIAPVIRTLGGGRGDRVVDLPDLIPGVTLSAIYASGTRFMVTYGNAGAVAPIVVEVQGDLGYLRDSQPFGTDNANLTAVGRESAYPKDINRSGEFVKSNEVFQGPNRVSVQMDWSGRVSKLVSPATRRMEWTSDPAEIEFPVRMNARFDITETSAHGHEDINGASWTENPGGVIVGAPGAAASGYNAGLYVTSLDIADGSTIDDAQLRFGVWGVTGTGNIATAGFDTDTTPSAFSASLPSARSMTAGATTVAVLTKANDQTVDVTTPLQNYIDGAGWNSGQDAAAMIRHITTIGYRSFVIPDAAPWMKETPNPPLLEVFFTAPGGATASPPRRRALPQSFHGM